MSQNHSDTHSQKNQNPAQTEDQQELEPQDFQPESGSIDRAERMSTRQSSPTNPRVSDKPESNQEEA